MDNTKIKIEINGYTVYANNVEEARGLIGVVSQISQTAARESNTKLVEKKPDGRRFNGYNFHKRKQGKVIDKEVKKSTVGEMRPGGHNPNSRWQPEEVQYILDNAQLGCKAVMASKNLLARHTKMGIQQMYWKASRNPRSYVVRRDIQAVIDAYYAKYPGRLLVKGSRVETDGRSSDN